MKDPLKLTNKQRLYVKYSVQGATSLDAALRAGYAPSTAKQASELKNKPAVKAAFKDVLRRAGLTDAVMARKLREGTEASRTQYFADHGTVVDQRDHVSWDTRAKHLDIALRIAGHLVDKHEVKMEHSIDGRGFERMLGRVRSAVFSPEALAVGCDIEGGSTLDAIDVESTHQDDDT